MQNATKKLIASLSVVLMGIGIAGAANAATRNIMVLTQKKRRFLYGNNISQREGKSWAMPRGKWPRLEEQQSFRDSG